MQMICEGDNKGCYEFCSHGKPHAHTRYCDAHFVCGPKTCSLFVSDKPQPLTKSPGVEFAHQECYLIPVKAIRNLGTCASWFEDERR